MKINVDDYSYNRSLVRNLIKRKGEQNYKTMASEYAVTASCPVFVVYYFMGEQIGFNEFIITRMKALSKFYHYTDIESKYDEGFSIDLDKEQFLKRD